MWDEPFVFCFLVSSSYFSFPLGICIHAPLSPLPSSPLEIKPFMTFDNIKSFRFLYATFFSSGDSEPSTTTGGALSRT